MIGLFTSLLLLQASLPDEARQAMARVKLQKGFSASLFAAEPQLANPVAFALDPNGAVYVVETFRLHQGVLDLRDHMDWLEDDLACRTVEERVAMMRRKLGDKFAETSVACERLIRIGGPGGDRVLDDRCCDPADGVAAGVLSRGGDLYYACLPKLLKLRDGERRVLLDGFGVHTSMIGHDLHGLRIGPDGRLYFSMGDRGLNVKTESGRVELPGTGAVLRCELDGSKLELFAIGLRNPQDLAFDEFGNLFTGDNNADGGDRARWVHVVEGGDCGYRYGYQWIDEPHLRGPWNEEKLWHPHFAGQAAYIVPPVSWLGSGPSGITYDPGTGLTEESRRHFFTCDFTGDPESGAILTFALKPKGASFEIGPVEKFASGLLPTDVEIGPDGALWWLDWVSGWKKTGKGRIYRIAHPSMKGRADVERTASLLREGMERRGVAELASLLADADQRVRQDAELELAERRLEGVQALAAAARADESLLARLHGVWGLGVCARRGTAVDAKLLVDLLSDVEAEVRAQAAGACGEMRAKQAAPKLIDLLRDASPRVRLFAAIALGKIGLPEATEPLLALARETGDDDPVLRHGAVMGLAGCATGDRLAAAASDPSADARVAAVVALRRRRDPIVERFLRAADSRVALEAARAVYDLPLEPALPALASLLESPPDSPPLVRRILAAAFRLGGETRARALALFAARAGAPDALRVEALLHLQHWRAPSGIDPISGEWRPIARSESEHSEAARFLPALALEIASPLFAGSANGHPPAGDDVALAWLGLVESCAAVEAAPRLAKWVASGAERSPKVRAAALAALEKMKPADLGAVLKGALADPEPELRVAALEAIRSSAPGETFAAAETALSNGTVGELRFAYGALASLKSAEADDLLSKEIDQLAAGLVPAEAQLELVAAGESRFPDALARRLPVREAAKKADSTLAPWLDTLYGGDAAAGRRIFRNDAALACLRCHKGDDGEGGMVGPDLRGVGARSTRLRLLESIVDPNRRIAAGYQGAALVLKDGSLVAGRVEREIQGHLFVRKPDNRVIELENADISERRSDVSAMPDGMTQQLSKREMRDLIEYLAGLR